jgi:hypothetical protein
MADLRDAKLVLELAVGQPLAQLGLDTGRALEGLGVRAGPLLLVLGFLVAVGELLREAGRSSPTYFVSVEARLRRAVAVSVV